MRSRWFGFVLAALAAAVSVWAYPRLPGSVAIHWNLQGQPDGYWPRFWAVALMPLFILGMAGLFTVLPRLDPKHMNYAKFVDTYWLIANAVLTFLAVMHGLIVASGLGYEVRVDRLMPLGLGLLFAFLGNYLTRVEPNWFVGFRTPWTLSSDVVWRKTHRTGGWLFVIGGFVVAAAGFGPKAAFLPLFVTTMAVVVIAPIVQSYVLWRREQK